MDIDTIRSFLGWCTLINFGLLLFWFGLLVFARGLIFNLHSKWFKLSEQHFDTIHYCGIGLYKLTVWMFFAIPYLVLYFAF